MNWCLTDNKPLTEPVTNVQQDVWGRTKPISQSKFTKTLVITKPLIEPMLTHYNEMFFWSLNSFIQKQNAFVNALCKLLVI